MFMISADHEEHAAPCSMPPIAYPITTNRPRERGHQDRGAEAGGEVGFAGGGHLRGAPPCRGRTAVQWCHTARVTPWGPAPYSTGVDPLIRNRRHRAPTAGQGCHGSKIASWRPILRVAMRRKNLLTQVLVANLLLIVAAVVATGVAGNPELRPRRAPGAGPDPRLRRGADDPRQRVSCSSAASARSSGWSTRWSGPTCPAPAPTCARRSTAAASPRRWRGCSAPSGACSSASRPSGAAPRAPRSPPRRRSARASPATSTTRSTSR